MTSSRSSIDAAPTAVDPARRIALSAVLGGSADAAFRLRKHADYQVVYAASRKQHGKQMSYFFRLRVEDSAARDVVDSGRPRIGLTVPKALGGAVDRNRIKRRMREVVRRHRSLLSSPVDVILHPRRSVIDLDFAVLEREVATVFRAIQKMVERQTVPQRTAQQASRKASE
jgi:ribonuclease P protein component